MYIILPTEFLVCTYGVNSQCMYVCICYQECEKQFWKWFVCSQPACLMH